MHYQTFVLDGIEAGHRSEYYDAVDGRILGEGPFVEVEKVEARAGEEDRPRLKLRPEAFLREIYDLLGKRPGHVVGAAKGCVEGGHFVHKPGCCGAGRSSEK